MAIHRISDRAEFLLQRMAAAEGKKPGQFLHDLIMDYAAGLSFENDPELDGLQAPRSDDPSASDADGETNDLP